MAEATSTCRHCEAAIEWSTDNAPRPWPANKDGSVHRCPVERKRMNELLDSADAHYKAE